MAERHLRSNREPPSDWSWPIGLLLGLALVALALVWRRRSQTRLVPKAAEERVAAPTLTFRGKDYHPGRASDGTAIWSTRPGEGGNHVLAAQVQLAQALLPLLEDALRDGVPPDLKDAVLYARHPAFSGHTVEITVSPSGRLLGANLLG